MTANVIVLRGIPGSGKTTLRNKRWPQAWVVSADHFFEELGKGFYKFDPSKLGEAHGQCLRNFIAHCRAQAKAQEDGTVVNSTIVVDNTGISIAEVAPYVAVAQAYGLEVQIITVMCDAAVAAKRNTHGVPEATVLKMAAALDAATKQLPPWWDHTIATGD